MTTGQILVAIILAPWLVASLWAFIGLGLRSEAGRDRAMLAHPCNERRVPYERASWGDGAWSE